MTTWKEWIEQEMKLGLVMKKRNNKVYEQMNLDFVDGLEARHQTYLIFLNVYLEIEYIYFLGY